jgi:hypothetical protein
MKVEQQILEVVNELIKEGAHTTISIIADRVSKTPQYIHQVLKNSKLLKKVIVEGRVEVFPVDAPQKTEIPYTRNTEVKDSQVKEPEQEEEPSYDNEGEPCTPYDLDDDVDSMDL